MPEAHCPTPRKTEADSIAEIVRAGSLPVIPQEEVSAAMRHNWNTLVFRDKAIVDLEGYRPQPDTLRARVDLYETASFITYLNRFKDGTTQVFAKADEQGGAFTAFLTYHHEEGLPRWGNHVCKLTLATTPEWRRWTKANGVSMSQEAFAEFLQDNLPDIVAPDAGALIDMVSVLSGTKNAYFKSAKNLKNGASNFQYVETIEVRGQPTRQDREMDIPDEIVLGIIPFVGGNGVQMRARLRYRIVDAKLTFHIVLDRPHKIVEEAVKVAISEIEKATGLRVYLGSAAIPADKRSQ